MYKTKEQMTEVELLRLRPGMALLTQSFFLGHPARKAQTPSLT